MRPLPGLKAHVSFAARQRPGRAGMGCLCYVPAPENRPGSALVDTPQHPGPLLQSGVPFPRCPGLSRWRCRRFDAPHHGPAKLASQVTRRQEEFSSCAGPRPHTRRDAFTGQPLPFNPLIPARMRSGRRVASPRRCDNQAARVVSPPPPGPPAAHRPDCLRLRCSRPREARPQHTEKTTWSPSSKIRFRIGRPARQPCGVHPAFHLQAPEACPRAPGIPASDVSLRQG